MSALNPNSEQSSNIFIGRKLNLNRKRGSTNSIKIPNLTHLNAFAFPHTGWNIFSFGFLRCIFRERSSTCSARLSRYHNHWYSLRSIGSLVVIAGKELHQALQNSHKSWWRSRLGKWEIECFYWWVEIWCFLTTRIIKFHKDTKQIQQQSIDRCYIWNQLAFL